MPPAISESSMLSGRKTIVADQAPDRGGQQDLVRDDAVVEVDPRHRDQHRRERQPEREVVIDAARERRADEHRGGERLDERVARADRRRRSCGSGRAGSSHESTGMLS